MAKIKKKMSERKKIFLINLSLVFIVALVVIGVYTGGVVSTGSNACTRSEPPSLVKQYEDVYKYQFYNNIKKTCYSYEGMYYCKFMTGTDGQKFGWYTKAKNKCEANDVYVCEDYTAEGGVNSSDGKWRFSERCTGVCVDGICKEGEAPDICKEKGYPGKCSLNKNIAVPSEVSSAIDSYGKDKFLSEHVAECSGVDGINGQKKCKYFYDNQSAGMSYGWYLFQEKKCELNSAYYCKEISDGQACWIKSADCGDNSCYEGMCLKTDVKCHEADLNFDGLVNATDLEIIKTVASSCTDLNADGVIDQKDSDAVNSLINQRCDLIEKVSCMQTDLNSDGIVDNSDLVIFKTEFEFNACGNCTNCFADINNDQKVDQLDYYAIDKNINEVCDNPALDAMT